MKKRNTSGILAVLGIALVVAMIFFMAGGGEYLTAITSGSWGLRVTGITADRTISNDADIANAKFIVNTVIDGSGGAVWGTTVGEPFRDNAGKVIPTNYDIKITADSLNEYAVYPIRNEGLLLRKYEVEIGSFLMTCPENTVYERSPMLARQCVYWVPDMSANKGILPSVSERFDVKITADRGDETASGTISSGSESVRLITPSGEYIGDAVWTGSLATGQQPDEPGIYTTISATGRDDVWKVIHARDWKAYDDEEQRFLTILRGWEGQIIPPDAMKLRAEVESVNMKADETLALPQVNIMGIGQTQETVGYDDYVFKVKLSEALMRWYKPQVLFYIKADWVGAYVPVSQPEIVGTSFVEVQSGSVQTLDVRVKNIGGVTSTFIAIIVEPCIIKQEQFSRQATIAPGATATITIPVSTGTHNIDDVGRCQVEVYDSTVRTNNAFAYFDYHAKKAAECTNIGQYYDEGNDCIGYCNLDGMREHVKCCAGDEDLNFKTGQGIHGGWICVKKSSPTPTPTPTPTPDDCYQNCIEINECGIGITGAGVMCLLQCKIVCFIYDNLIYLVIGGGGVVLWFGFKVFKRFSPHAQVARRAYRTVKKR